MAQLFDEVAGRFAGDIDTDIVNGRYVRGNLFVRLALASVPKGASILDYGCGPGRISIMLARAGYTVHGVDTSAGMIEQARALDHNGLNVTFGPIHNAEEALPPGAYDAIVCSSVIEYVADANELLSQFHRALRRPGTLIISFANASSVWRRRWRLAESPNPMAPGQHHVWNWKRFSALLVDNRFKPLMRPEYFESPWEARPWARLARHLPYVGTLGLVAAQPLSGVPPE